MIVRSVCIFDIPCNDDFAGQYKHKAYLQPSFLALVIATTLLTVLLPPLIILVVLIVPITAVGIIIPLPAGLFKLVLRLLPVAFCLDETVSTAIKFVAFITETISTIFSAALVTAVFETIVLAAFVLVASAACTGELFVVIIVAPSGIVFKNDNGRFLLLEGHLVIVILGPHRSRSGRAFGPSIAIGGVVEHGHNVSLDEIVIVGTELGLILVRDPVHCPTLRATIVGNILAGGDS